MWTEIVTEHIAVVHIGSTTLEKRIMVPISDVSNIADNHVSIVKEQLEKKALLEHQRQQTCKSVASINER